MVRETHHTDENAESAIRKFNFKLCTKIDDEGYFLASHDLEGIGRMEGKKGYRTKAEAADAAMYIRQMFNFTDSLRMQVNHMAETRTPFGTARIARLYCLMQAARAQFEIDFEGLK